MPTNPNQEKDDRSLVGDFVRERAEDTFRALYRRHSPRLYRLALRLTGGDETDAADILQETWIRAAERLQDFEWRSALSTWLSGIAINCSREQLRRTIRRRETSLEDSLASTTESSKSFPQEHLDLERAVAALAEGYREILILHDIEGFTHEEIARQLGIDPGTSKSQLSRARGKLRMFLSGSPREEKVEERGTKKGGEK